MKKPYRAPEANPVILNTDDIITLSSVLEPDYQDEDLEQYGVPNAGNNKIIS